MKRTLFALLASAAALGAVQPASAAISWADLTSSTASTVTGNIGGVTVTYSGDIGFVQTSGGTQFWLPFSSVDGPATGPDPTDIIATNLAGTKTITFSQSVTDVYLALNSWNGQSARFDHPFTVYAEGCGYWGCGSAIVSAGGYSLTSPNELHGILKFAGPITSLSYVDTANEYWHGIQIGIGGVTGAVPEPASWAMMIAGFGLMGAAMRRRQRGALHLA